MSSAHDRIRRLADLAADPGITKADLPLLIWLADALWLALDSQALYLSLSTAGTGPDIAEVWVQTPSHNIPVSLPGPTKLADLYTALRRLYPQQDTSYTNSLIHGFSTERLIGHPITGYGASERLVFSCSQR